MAANCIITENEEKEEKEDSEILDEETLCTLLNVKMKKFLSKTKENDIKVIWNECEKILNAMKIPKNSQKSVVKKWVEQLKRGKI